MPVLLLSRAKMLSEARAVVSNLTSPEEVDVRLVSNEELAHCLWGVSSSPVEPSAPPMGEFSV